MTFCNLFAQLNNCFNSYTTFGGWGNSTFNSYPFFNCGFNSLFNFSGFTFPSLNPFNFNNSGFETPNFTNISFNSLPANQYSFNNTSIFNNTNSFNNMALPSFDSFCSNTTYNRSNTSVSKSSQSTKTPVYKIGNFKLDYWKARGYDHEKGKALALDAAKVTKGRPHECIGYTRRTINKIYGTNVVAPAGHRKAYEFGKYILSAPELKGKFRKATKEEIEKGGIPDGAVVLWAPGSPGFTKSAAATCGHGGICYQNKVYSNYVESRHLNTYQEIWIPVKS